MKYKKIILIGLSFAFAIISSISFYYFFYPKEKVEIKYKVNDLNDLLQIFPKNTNELDARSNRCIGDMQNKINQIIKIDDSKQTFENTILAFDEISSSYYPIYYITHAITLICPDKELRRHAYKILLKLHNFFIDNVEFNTELYKTIKKYYERNIKNENLSLEKNKLVISILNNYKKNGIELSIKKISQIKDLKKELTELKSRFNSNIARHRCRVEVSLKQLDGLKKSFIESLTKTKSGKYILRCDYPTYFTVISNCKVESTRKKIYLAFTNRAYPNNIKVLKKFILKANSLAKLLGYESYAHLILDDQMAKSPENLEKFLTNLSERISLKAKNEIDQLKLCLPKSVKLNNGKFNRWDLSYLKNLDHNINKKIKKQFFLNEYFQTDPTIEKVLQIYGKFLDLEFKQNVITIWDIKLKLIEVYDKIDNKFIGYIILDLFPRKNKYTHSIHKLVIRGRKDFSVGVSLIITNFPKPDKNNISLLKLRDVKTFFHEFAHAMQNILNESVFYIHSRSDKKKDFSEISSMFFSNWIYDREILKFIGSHYKTGNPIPEDIIESIINPKNKLYSCNILWNIYLSFLSLEFFKNGINNNFDEIAHKLYDKMLFYTSWENDAHMEASFDHLVNFGPSYYSYLWSEVYAKDLLEEIDKYGRMNSIIGKKYKNTVLRNNLSKDPNESIKNFLGREPTFNAFLKSF